MSTPKSRIKTYIVNIFTKYLSGKTTGQEDQLVDKLFEQLNVHDVENINYDAIHQDIKEKVDKVVYRTSVGSRRKRYYKISIAASLLFAFSFGLFYVIKVRNNSLGLSTTDFLTLSSPQLILNKNEAINLFDSLPSGTTLDKEGEQFLLDLANMEMESEDLVEINNPTATSFTILMKDHSKIILSSNSSISFRSTFDKISREVTASGEVDFEVSKIKTDDQFQPFIVRTRLQTIEVLGTQFHVSASLDGEENVKLNEGSIKLAHNKSAKSIILRPGEQAYLQENQSRIMISSNSNEAKLKAWRRGEFYFENETMKQVMAEVSSWYDVPIIVSEGVAPRMLTGIFSRYEDIVEVMKVLEMTNSIKFYEKKGTLYVDVK